MFERLLGEPVNTKFELIQDKELNPNFPCEVAKYLKKNYYRVKAKRNIGDDVKKGDIGGYVISDGYLGNLGMEGECWIYDNSIATNFADIRENAKVRNNSFITDATVIKGNSIIDNSIIYGGGVSRNCKITNSLSYYEYFLGLFSDKENFNDFYVKNIKNQEYKGSRSGTIYLPSYYYFAKEHNISYDYIIHNYIK